MREIDIDESKKIMLKMLEEVDAFCKANNITYFLTGGTLLGAIRHNGYIPWDDDIDIALPRKDYERLLREFKSTSGDLEILYYKNRKNYIWPAAKIVNTRTVLIENGLKVSPIGVFLDMFPLDTIAGDFEEAKTHVKKVCRWKDMLTLKYMRVSKSRTFFKNVVVVAAKALYIIPDRFIIDRINTLSCMYENQNDCHFICNLSGAWRTKEIVNKDIFKMAVDHVFEGKIFSIPIGYNELLKNLYGNYMELPPENKRVSTHRPKSYWK